MNYYYFNYKIINYFKIKIKLLLLVILLLLFY